MTAILDHLRHSRPVDADGAWEGVGVYFTRLGKIISNMARGNRDVVPQWGESCDRRREVLAYTDDILQDGPRIIAYTQARI